MGFAVGIRSWRRKWRCLCRSVSPASTRGGSKCKQAVPGYCAKSTPVLADSAHGLAVTAAPAAVALPATIIYFAQNKFDIPIGVELKRVDAVAHLKANANTNARTKATSSDFSDPSGNVAHDEALAHKRASAVRCSFEAAGIPKDRVVMRRSVRTAGDGPPKAAGTMGKLS